MVMLQTLTLHLRGEVGFGYIMDGTDGMSTAGNPSRPYRSHTIDWLTAAHFDGDPFDKKAVLLRIDNSATSVNIRVPAGSPNNSGVAIVGGGPLMVATNPIWGGTTPVMQEPFAQIIESFPEVLETGRL